MKDGNRYGYKISWQKITQPHATVCTKVPCKRLVLQYISLSTEVLSLITNQLVTAISAGFYGMERRTMKITHVLQPATSNTIQCLNDITTL